MPKILTIWRTRTCGSVRAANSGFVPPNQPLKRIFTHTFTCKIDTRALNISISDLEVSKLGIHKDFLTLPEVAELIRSVLIEENYT